MLSLLFCCLLQSWNWALLNFVLVHCVLFSALFFFFEFCRAKRWKFLVLVLTSSCRGSCVSLSSIAGFLLYGQRPLGVRYWRIQIVWPTFRDAVRLGHFCLGLSTGRYSLIKRVQHGLQLVGLTSIFCCKRFVCCRNVQVAP